MFNSQLQNDQRGSRQEVDIVVLHPSPFMIEPVDALLAELAPELTHRNVVVPDLLSRAQGGLTGEIRAEMRSIIKGIANTGDPIVMCSCSTLGGIAEEEGRNIGIRVIRIDRPMAEKAISLGRVIGVAAALESTIVPTSDLLHEVAKEKNKEIMIKEIVCADAWQLKQAGDNDGYVLAVADCIRKSFTGLDVVVLAQGSMAPAADLLKDLAIEVLSSPRLGCQEIAKLALTYRGPPR